MSYTDINCMEYFTPKQGERMRNAINTLSYLQQTVTDNCLVQKLSSIEQLCYDNNQTLTISNISNNSATWQVSSNVAILSSNNNSITVRASSSNSTGNGWIRATLSNGIILQEDFEVGTPQSSSMRFNRSASYNFLNDRWNILGVNYNGLIDFGQLGYIWEFQVPSSLVRHSPNNSYVHLRPIARSNYSRIYIKTRASNECGCSEWYGQWFNVRYRSSDPCRDSNNRPCDDGIVEY